MLAKATIADPMQFPGATFVNKQGDDGYMVYGPEKDGIHKAIAILRRAKDGKYLVEASSAIVATLGSTTPVADAQTEMEYPIYRTVVEVIIPGRPNTTAVDIGPRPTGPTQHGRRVISTEPAPDWTLKRILDREYQIAKPVAEPELDDEELN